MDESDNQNNVPKLEVRPILNQTQVELQMLQSAKNGLLATLDWQTQGDTFARKLSTLRFVVQVFQAQLERIFALEEHDGYMGIVQDSRPELAERVEAFRNEHQQLRSDLLAAATKLDRLMPDDQAGLGVLSQMLQDIIRQHDDHSQRETALVQDALMSDIGTGD